MSYQEAIGIPLKPLRIITGKHNNDPTIEDIEPQVVFDLDGDLVAMAFGSKRIANLNTLSCRITAWLVDEQGDVQAVDGEEPIYIDYKHNAHAAQVEACGGAAGVAAALRDMVFGETVIDLANSIAPIPVSTDVMDSVNIRYAIVAARAAGEVIDLVTATTPAMPPTP